MFSNDFHGSSRTLDTKYYKLSKITQTNLEISRHLFNDSLQRAFCRWRRCCYKLIDGCRAEMEMPRRMQLQQQQLQQMQQQQQLQVGCGWRDNTDMDA